MILVGLSTVVITVVGPIIAVASYQPLVQEQQECAEDENSIRINGYTTALVNVLKDSKEKRLRIPNISHAQFLKTFPSSQGESHLEEVKAMSPPFTFVAVMNRSKGGREYFLINESIAIQEGAGIVFCVSKASSQGYRIGHILRK